MKIESAGFKRGEENNMQDEEISQAFKVRLKFIKENIYKPENTRRLQK
jgi:hypothetical protein